MKFYGGIKMMKSLPQVLVCFDPVQDINAVKEAKIMNISIVGVGNTNANPDLIDFLVPANNYSVRASYLIVNCLADAIATANDQPTLVANRPIEEINLPEIAKKTPYHRPLARGEYLRNNPSFKPNNETLKFPKETNQQLITTTPIQNPNQE